MHQVLLVAIRGDHAAGVLMALPPDEAGDLVAESGVGGNGLVEISEHLLCGIETVIILLACIPVDFLGLGALFPRWALVAVAGINRVINLEALAARGQEVPVE